MKLKELSTHLSHLSRPNRSRQSVEIQTGEEKLRLAEPGINKKVGGTALIEYVNKAPAILEEETQKDFGHLFPVQYLMEKHPDGHVTLEDAHKPYRYVRR